MSASCGYRFDDFGYGGVNCDSRGGGIAPTRRSSRRSMIRRARGRAPSFLGMISTAAAAHGYVVDRPKTNEVE